MSLEPHASRCVRRGEIHELVATSHTATTPGTRIDDVAFLGFAEIACGGVIDRGDRLTIAGRCVGTVLGFDACHYPNHYNVLVSTAAPQSGTDLELEPEDAVRFDPASPP